LKRDTPPGKPVASNRNAAKLTQAAVLTLILLAAQHSFSSAEEKTPPTQVPTTLASPAAETNRAQWMQDHLDVLGDRPLKRLVLPAAHDAAMYRGGFPESIAQTQDMTVYEQLSYGIRYFDLRPMWDVGKLFIHHGPVRGPQLADVLGDVRRFAEKHRELVILKFSHEEGFRDESAYKSLVKQIKTNLGPWLYRTLPKGKRLAEIALSEFVAQGCAILVVCDGDYPLDYRGGGVWVFRDWDSAHPEQGDLRVYDKYSNTMSYAAMKTDQLGKFERYDGKCKGRPDVPCDLFLLSWTLTPATNVRAFAAEPNRNLETVLKWLKIPNRHGFVPNLLYTDYVKSANLTDVAVQLNLAISATERVTELNQQQASSFANLALKAIQKEYPNKPEHVLNSEADIQGPRSLHPAFYGSFDWHSSVHGHWMLIRLLRRFPDLPEGSQIREVMRKDLTAPNIQVEADYFAKPNRQSFERTYGWAWLLKLAEELHSWDDAEGRQWAKNLEPLTGAIASRYITFLPKQTYPIRSGVHPNTAFGLSFALDYARAVGNKPLASVIEERSRFYFASDAGIPAAWEPSGADFLSPSLMEADLMRRVMPAAEFQVWLGRFLPSIARGEPKSLFLPAEVTDRTDPQLVHLDGVNLSRAWCMRSIAKSLPKDDPARKALEDSADRHADAALRHVASGDYAGEHWLASFAVYLLTEP
jgi:hypothetical protein